MLEEIASFALKLTPEFDLCAQIGECAPSICEKGESNGWGGRLQDRCSFITSGGHHRGSEVFRYLRVNSRRSVGGG